ncbi:MAG: hypothetical protein AABW79_00320 [Nanoarchaeota archaeon]
MIKKRSVRFVLIGFFLVVLLIAGYFFYDSFFAKPQYSTWTPREITQENLPSELGKFAVVQDMPESGIIGLRVGEEDYTISGNSVSSGASERADVYVSIPESYLDKIGEQGWCSGLQQARTNGDLIVDIRGPEASLGLKYRALLKYGGCLG